MNISGLTKPIVMSPTSSGKSDHVINGAPFEWNSRSVMAGLVETGRVHDALLSHLKLLLDDFHGVERSIEYYDLVAGDWLLVFSHNVYVAWQEVLAGTEIIESSMIPAVFSVDHAVSLSTEPPLHQHLRWAVAESLQGNSSENWSVTQESIHIESGSQRGYLSSIKGLISIRNPKILFTSPYFKVSRSEWMSALWRWRHWITEDSMQYPISFHVRHDWSWRKRRSASFLSLNEDYAAVVKALMSLYIPVPLLEGLAAYRKAVFSFSLPRPDAVYSANALLGNLTWKILAAEWRQEGSQILYHQHGGGYGLEPMLAVEVYEMRVSDRFYSWGWLLKGRKNIKALSPAIPQQKTYSRRKGILLSCVDFPKVQYRLLTYSTYSAVEKIHQHTCSFLLLLTQRRDIMIRPYPKDYGWGVVERMRNAAPYARFDSQSNSFTLFFHSSLVVHNYLGTGWLETLGLNIPTLCFYDPDAYLFREAAQAHIDTLIAVGILHHSGHDAARFVAALGDAVEEWWNKIDVQEARRNFAEHYANFSPDWKQEWENEFEEVLDEAH